MVNNEISIYQIFLWLKEYVFFGVAPSIIIDTLSNILLGVAILMALFVCGCYLLVNRQAAKIHSIIDEYIELDNSQKNLIAEYKKAFEMAKQETGEKAGQHLDEAIRKLKRIDEQQDMKNRLLDRYRSETI